jgi:oligosaccharide repeat unit polymerase
MAFYAVHGIPSESMDINHVSLIAGAVFILLCVINIVFFKLEISSPAMFFFLLLGMFHLGMIVPYAMNLTSIVKLTTLLDSLSYFNVHVFTCSVLYVIASLFAFEIGLLVSMTRWRSVSQRADGLQLDKAYDEGETHLYMGGLLLFGISMMMILSNLVFAGAGSFFSGSYSKYFLLNNDTRLLATGLYFLMPVSIIIGLCGTDSKKQIRNISLLFVFLSIIYLWLGDRGDFFFFAAAFVFAWRRLNYKLPRSILFVGFIVAFLLTSFVGEFRQHDRTDLHAEALSEAATKVSLVSSLVEMGGSIRTLAGTVALVPEKFSFRFGETYINALLRIVPNLWVIRNTSDKDLSPESMSPNHWITIRMNEHVFKRGGGYGFSAVAEPYLNFGSWGIALYFFLLGFFLVDFDYRTLRLRDRHLIAACSIVMMALLVTVRNDYENFLRPAVWGIGLVWILRICNRFFSPRRKRMASASPLV